MAQETHLRDSTLVIAAKGFQFVTVFLLGVLVTRCLSREDFGTYSQIILLVSSLSLILGVWLGKSFFYFVPSLSAPRQFVSETLAVLTGVGAVAAVLLVVLGRWVAALFDNQALLPLLPLTGGYLLVMVPYYGLEPYLISTGNARTLALANFAQTAIQTCLVTGLLLVFRSISSVLVALIAVNALMLGFFWLHVLRLPAGEPRTAEASVGRQIAYAGPLFVAGLLMVCSRNLDKFIVAAVLKTSEFALYSRGAIEIPIVVVVAHTVSALLLPRFVRFHRGGHHQDFVVLWHRTLRRTLLIVAPAFAFLFLVAPPLVALLYSAEYLPSARVFRVYLLTLLIQITSYDAILQSFARTRVVLQGSLLNAVITLGAGILLMRRFGFVGPAWAFIGGQAVSAVFYLFHIRKVLSLSLRELFPWGTMFRTLLAAFACAWVSTEGMARLLTGQGGGFLMLSGIAFAPLYLGAAWAFRLLGPADLRFLRSGGEPSPGGE